MAVGNAQYARVIIISRSTDMLVEIALYCESELPCTT